MEIGDNIRKYREIQGLTLPDLATQAGVSKAFLWEIESGKSKRPGAEVLFKIAQVLGVTIAHLLGREPEKTEQNLIEPEINDGLRAFINECKRRGNPLEADEIKSLSFVQLKGGRPTTKQQWALVYGMLKEMTGGGDG
ncbi:MAG: helix-turn-helix transcriptional regulator [Gemmatimonadetes bacterium]|nr:helix-turn-helix transcriptional regulator [Gemmatimonadota bacterium]